MARYGPAYRFDELSLILRSAMRGDSLGLMGVAGTGKSNIVRILRDDMDYKARILGEKAAGLLVAEVNTIKWDGTPENLWEIMEGSLNRALAQSKLKNIRPLKTGDGSPLGALGLTMEWVCQQKEFNLLFVLDDFDKAIAHGPLAMLDHLSDFRTANVDRLSYLVMTKRLPHILGRDHDLAQHSKFYHLFRNRIYALGMYTPDDSRQMIRHLNEQHEAGIGGRETNFIQWLSGGHAGLIRSVFDAWIDKSPDHNDLVRSLADRGPIQEECRRIIHSLHEDEQDALRRLAAREMAALNQPVLEHLHVRGLLTSLAPVLWFSPLFQEYLEKSGGNVQ